ncbi:hypothetical protein [Sphingomonas adhaesiva]|uniref:hypothetical protein n=1 Tax=Sphingomonas adhaesiva TaxID=28212 RepID=UPI002FF9207E
MTTFRCDAPSAAGPKSWGELSARTRSALEAANVSDAIELSNLTKLELLSIKRIGGKGYLECLVLLENCGLILKVLDPEFDFRPAYNAIKKHVDGPSPFQMVGERLGISGQLAYDLYVLLEKAAVASGQARRNHERWRKLQENLK